MLRGRGLEGGRVVVAAQRLPQGVTSASLEHDRAVGVDGEHGGGLGHPGDARQPGQRVVAVDEVRQPPPGDDLHVHAPAVERRTDDGSSGGPVSDQRPPRHPAPEGGEAGVPLRLDELDVTGRGVEHAVANTALHQPPPGPPTARRGEERVDDHAVASRSGRTA